MKQSVPKSVDEYLAAQPEAVRPKLEQVRAAIRRAVPEAVEGIGYRMPGYKLHGKPMLYFAGFKEHYSLFAASGTFFAALEDELRGYELRRGTVHFPLTKPVPVKLISRIAKLRAAGIAATKKPLLAELHDHQYVKGTKSCRDYYKEVTGHNHLGVVMDEGQSTLLRIRCAHRAGT